MDIEIKVKKINKKIIIEKASENIEKTLLSIFLKFSDTRIIQNEYNKFKTDKNIDSITNLFKKEIEKYPNFIKYQEEHNLINLFSNKKNNISIPPIFLKKNLIILFQDLKTRKRNFLLITNKTTDFLQIKKINLKTDILFTYLKKKEFKNKENYNEFIKEKDNFFSIDTINNKKKYNSILISPIILQFYFKHFYFLDSLSFYYEMLPLTFDVLEKGGELYIYLPVEDNELMDDLLKILIYSFEKVELKSNQVESIFPIYQSHILYCNGFKNPKINFKFENQKTHERSFFTIFEENEDIFSIDVKMKMKENESQLETFRILKNKLTETKNYNENIYNLIELNYKNNQKGLEETLINAYKSYLIGFVNQMEEYKIPIPPKFQKLVKKYDSSFINQIFSFPNSYSQRLICYACENTNNKSNIINSNTKKTMLESLTRFYDAQRYGKELRRMNLAEDEKRFKEVTQIVESFTRGVARYIQNRMETSRKVSNAFTKAWEIYTDFSFGFKSPKSGDTVVSFHFAELPGQFINSLAYYCSSKLGKHLDWMGESLHPFHPDNVKIYGEGAIFANQYGLWSNYKDNWIFGDPTNKKFGGTGDLTDPKILKYFRDFNLNKRKPQILTADAGLRSSEIDILPLQKLELAQAIALMSSCPKGSDIIVKHFTPHLNNKPITREAGPQMVSLIYLYYLRFKKVYLFEPVTSNPTSGEYYVIGLNCKEEMTDKEFDNLCSLMKNLKINEPFYPINKIGKEFILQITKFLEVIQEQNFKAVENQNYLFVFYDEFMEETHGQLYKIFDKKYETWVDEFGFN